MDTIVGNEELKDHFMTAIRQKKISHACILEGEKGSGKKKMAEAYARILMCETPVDGPAGPKACGSCQSCIMFDHKDHPDVIYVEHEKPNSIGVKDIRDQVVNTVDLMPYKGPWKIYIIDEAEKMTQAAQNTILKTIEEPPAYAVILLLASNRGAFLPTILSRCILLPMKPVPDQMVKNYLVKECGATKEEADFAGAFAMGNIGKAREAVLSEDFLQLKQFGLSLLRHIHELTDYEIMGRLKEGMGRKEMIPDYLDMMEIWFRDLLVLKAARDKSRLIFSGEDRVLASQGKMLEYEDIHEIIKSIQEARFRLQVYVNPEAVLEVLHISTKNRFRWK